MSYLLIAANIVLLVSGQILWKIGVGKLSFPIGTAGLAKIVLSPWIVSGCAVYGLATAVWIYLLSKFPISFLYPLQSVAYVVMALSATVLFKEHVSAFRWVGIGLIMLGVILISKSN